MRGSNAVTAAVAMTLAIGAGSGVSAHRLDEYLQAARIDLQRDRVSVELHLTPGIELAESIVGLIDGNRDGVMSAAEQRAYAASVMAALVVTMDGEQLPLRLAASAFPELPAFRLGEGTIRLRVDANHPGVSGGAHQLLFRNTHLGDRSVYLVNTLVPENEDVSVTAQRRDSRQSGLTIDYAVRGGATVAAGWLLVGLPFAVVLMMRLTRR